MCTTFEGLTTKKKSYTGYKFVLKLNNKYYSPATGIEYKVGPVKRPNALSVYRIKKYKLFSTNRIIKKGALFYNKDMVGRTGVYPSPALAKRMMRPIGFDGSIDFFRAKLCLLKMKVSSDTRLKIGFAQCEVYCIGERRYSPIYLGNNLYSIKEIDETAVYTY